MKEKIKFKDLDWWLKIPVLYFWGCIGVLVFAIIVGIIFGFQ